MSHDSENLSNAREMSLGCGPAFWSALAVAIILLLAAAVLLPAVNGAREAARRATCQRNLAQIGVALQQYHATNGVFPPAYTVDAAGRPMHSWRALLLPYLGDEKLASDYDWNEPWDGPHNRALIDRIPVCYRCPSVDALAGTTNYVAIVGDKTMWPGAASGHPAETNAEQSNVIAVVDAPGSHVTWTEPRDIDLPALVDLLDTIKKSAVSVGHPGGVNVLRADGRVEFLNAAIDPRVLEQSVTAAQDLPTPTSD